MSGINLPVPVSAAGGLQARTGPELLAFLEQVYEDGVSDLELVTEPEAVVDARQKVAAMEAALARLLRDRDERLLAQNLLAELRLRQERAIGRWLADHVNHGGGGDRRSRSREGTAVGDLPQGISKNQSSRFQRLAAVPEAAFDRYLSVARDAREEITTAAALRSARPVASDAGQGADHKPAGSPGQAHSRKGSYSGRRYGTLYLDPPWTHPNVASTPRKLARKPVTVEQLESLPLGELAGDGAHLHLWTPSAYLFDCPRLLSAWGFEYRSVLVWAKAQATPGSWWQPATEFLVLGVRGACPFRDRTQPSWVDYTPGEKGAKPDEFRSLIERVSPGPYLELFGVGQAAGWTVWDEAAVARFAGKVAGKSVR